MKVRNYLTILFAVLAIVALIALAGFMTVYVADDSNPLRQQIMKVISPDESTNGEVPAPETSSEQAVTAAVREHSFIFMGDSRTVGMGKAVNDDCVYIGADGEGYEWLAQDGIQELDKYLSDDPNRTVIFNFGVNDPNNVNLYVDLYSSLIKQYPNTSFYFLSVNPLIDNKGYYATNDMINLFNSTLEKHLSINNCLDSASYLITNGFETVDGLHYTQKTYQAIHDYAVTEIFKKMDQIK